MARLKTVRPSAAAANPALQNKNLQTNPHPWKSPLGIVIHGLPGVGKSDFAANFPNTAFVIDPHEQGIRDLVAYGRTVTPKEIIQVERFEDLLNISKQLGVLASKGIETLVFDSMTGMEKLCFTYHCENEYDGDWSKTGFLSFQQGPKGAAKLEWPKFLNVLNEAIDLGINVILIAHTEVRPYQNPEGPDHDRYTPYMEKSTWQQIARWAQAILFYNFHYDVEKRKGGTKAKATGTPERQLYTDWSPAYDAKNRYGLEPVIDGGDSGAEAFANFCRAFPR